MSGKRSKWLILLLPLIVTTAAGGAPTISNSNVVNCARSISSGAHIPLVLETSQVTSPCDYQQFDCPELTAEGLAGIAAEFLKPPASPLSSPVHAKPLPAVPAAFFMALIGFICVSLVNDRRVWMAALTGLLWAGQTGIGAIPQLALRLSHGNHSNKRFSAEVDYSNYLLNSDRPRSDIEGTQYIGLLHHLAGIPDSTTSFYRTLSFLQKQESRKVTTQLYYRLNPSKNTNSFQSQSAFLSEQYSSNTLLVCLAPRAEQFICFSPAFIFCQLPRGPPIPA